MKNGRPCGLIPYYEPGLFNIVPEKVTLDFELRAPRLDEFQSLQEKLLGIARNSAGEFGLGFEMEFLGERLPVEIHPLAKGAILEAAKELGLKYMPFTSNAGHDAQMVASL